MNSVFQIYLGSCRTFLNSKLDYGRIFNGGSIHRSGPSQLPIRLLTLTISEMIPTAKSYYGVELGMVVAGFNLL